MDDWMNETDLTEFEFVANLPEASGSQTSPAANENISILDAQSTPEPGEISVDDYLTPIEQNQEQFVQEGDPAPSQSMQQPIDRLLNAIKSVSKEALISACEDMKRIVYDADNEFLKENPLPVPTTRRMKREFKSTSRDVSQQTYVMDNAPAKKSRNQSNDELLMEIAESNGDLTETVLKLSSHRSNGTIITCTYSPETVAKELTAKFGPCMKWMSQAALFLSIEFLVPSNYPSSSPEILYKSGDGVLAEHFMKKVRQRFDIQLRCCSAPFRVKQMAQAWNDSARESFMEHATSLGSETFSCRFGSWERISRDKA